MLPGACPAGSQMDSNIQGHEIKSNACDEGENAKDRCCEGSNCGCDDACLDELARAICADDDGHIHGHSEEIGSLALSETSKPAHASSDSLGSDGTCCCNASTQVSDNTLHAHTPPVAGVLLTSRDNNSNEVTVHNNNCTIRKRNMKSHTKGVDKLPKEACGEHKSIAQNRHKDTLAAFGCICKAMLARGLQACCTRPLSGLQPANTSANRSLRTSSVSKFSTRSRRSMSIDSCCGDSQCGKSSLGLPDKSSAVSVHSCCSDSNCKGSGENICGNETGSCKRESRLSVDSCCAASCCGKSGNEKEVDLEKQTINGTQKDITGITHVVLLVKGMTCTGCENKLIRTLHALPTIFNVKTSLVLSRAEFDYGGDEDDLRALIQSIEKRSGFSTEQIASTSTRALRLTIDPTLLDKLLALPRVTGIEEIVRVNKRILRVVYDPHLIGARQVLAAYASFCPVLAPEPPDPALAAGMKHIRSLGLRTILSAFLTIPVLVMAWAPLPTPVHPHAYAIASLALATLVQTVIAGPFYIGAFKSLFFSGLVETDLLIVLSTTTAYIYSVVAFGFDVLGRPLATGEFFETSTLLVTLIMVGQLISAFARQRAIEAISLRSLQQTSAILVHSDGSDRASQEEEIDARLLEYGDTFKVPPDSSIITDGTVVDGQSEVDESMMTGEALPVEKKAGSIVIAGTANGPSTLLVKVTRLPGENTISDIAALVDDARFSRARVQETVDRVCTFFVPVVLALAIVTFIVWLAVGIRVRGQGGGEAAVTALTYAIAVLAISCPCAIGLAVPMVILIASGVGARMGLVFKAATTIEGARSVTHVVFDKTGTLTLGRLEVTHAQVEAEDARLGFDVRAAVLGLVEASRHPVARAVAAHLTHTGAPLGDRVENVELVTGKGVQGYIRGGMIRGGSARWLNFESHPVVAPFLQEGLTVFCVAYSEPESSLEVLLGVFALSDTLRPETLAVISQLRSRNIDISMLSGDHPAAVLRVASALGIPNEKAKAGCLPADKQAYIQTLTKQSHKVLFCGDGTNDAVALAQADIGVHMQSGNANGAGAAAMSAADVVLIHPSLQGILMLFELSEAVNRRIVLNFAWSAVYNVVAILFAAGAFVHVRIAPAYAGLGEVVSVVPVVLVALQLKWFKGKI